MGSFGHGFVVLGISVPTFWLALVTILIFAVYLGWLPSIGYTRPQEDFIEFLKHIALPMSVVALNIAASVLRFQRQDSSSRCTRITFAPLEPRV